MHTVFKSRWGLHPVDYQTFCDLKRLHSWYHDALRRRAAWNRWNNKEPQNRILWEREGAVSWDGVHYRGARINRGVRPEPLWGEGDRQLLDRLIKVNIRLLIQTARRPQAMPVGPLSLSAGEIRSLAEKLD